MKFFHFSIDGNKNLIPNEKVNEYEKSDFKKITSSGLGVGIGGAYYFPTDGIHNISIGTIVGGHLNYSKIIDDNTFEKKFNIGTFFNFRLNYGYAFGDKQNQVLTIKIIIDTQSVPAKNLLVNNGQFLTNIGYVLKF